MTWQPEQGWSWLAGRWAVAAGAGALLGGAVWLGEPGPAGSALALDPTSTREVVLEPREQAVLSSLVPGAGAPEDAAVSDEEDGEDRHDPDSGTPDAPGPDPGSEEPGDAGSAGPDRSDDSEEPDTADARPD